MPPALLAILGLGAGVGIGALLFGGSGKVVLFSGKSTGDAELDLLADLSQANITFEIDPDPDQNIITISVASEDIDQARAVFSQRFRISEEGVLQRPR